MGVVPLDGGEKEMTRLGVKGVGKPLTIVLNVWGDKNMSITEGFVTYFVPRRLKGKKPQREKNWETRKPNEGEGTSQCEDWREMKWKIWEQWQDGFFLKVEGKRRGKSKKHCGQWYWFWGQRFVFSQAHGMRRWQNNLRIFAWSRGTWWSWKVIKLTDGEIVQILSMWAKRLLMFMKS